MDYMNIIMNNIIMNIIIGWSEKMAQLLVSHNFESRLRSHMKLHVRQFKYVFSWHINVILDLSKNMEMPNVLKNCPKIQYHASINAK